MFSLDLWEISGHAAKYKDDMFLLDVEKQVRELVVVRVVFFPCSNQRLASQTFGLKPMNCPGHCVMFRERARSYRELPMRFADFGVLHRNELSGTGPGLFAAQLQCVRLTHLCLGRRAERPHARSAISAGRRPHLLHTKPGVLHTRVPGPPQFLVLTRHLSSAADRLRKRSSACSSSSSTCTISSA